MIKLIQKDCEECPVWEGGKCHLSADEDCPVSQRVPEWQPDSHYQAQYAHACGYYD